jgi:hypothetical protein
LQQLGSSLGVAVLGTVFFSALGAHPHLGTFVHAAREIALIALGLNAAAFAIGFLLPKRARHAVIEPQAGADVREPELVTA